MNNINDHYMHSIMCSNVKYLSTACKVSHLWAGSYLNGKLYHYSTPLWTSKQNIVWLKILTCCIHHFTCNTPAFIHTFSTPNLWKRNVHHVLRKGLINYMCISFVFSKSNWVNFLLFFQTVTMTLHPSIVICKI